GITIHAMGCEKTLHLDPERKLEVLWDDKIAEPRQVQIRVESEDKHGLLSLMSNAFTDAKVNILSANCKTQRNGRAVNLFLVEVNDAGQLRQVMRDLNRLPGIIAAERVGS
ncbi:MAG: ACT domain-containing protein, partial [Myxococcota bacterium]